MGRHSSAVDELMAKRGIGEGRRESTDDEDEGK